MSRVTRGSVYLRGKTWWLTYYVDGERIQESARTRNRREAESILADRRREVREGTWVPPQQRTRRGPTVRTTPKVSTYLENWIAGRERAGVLNVRDERRWLREHVIPELGEQPIGDVTRVEIKALVQTVSEKVSPRTKRPYSARTVLHIYRTMALAFRDAERDGVIDVTPCTLLNRRGELPEKRDADTRWRARAVYTPDEAETLLGAEEIPLERRILYALSLLAGLRGSEATGRRWGDYDPKAKPLGRLVVDSQADGNKGERATKTGDVREVPVVPALAALLAEWRLAFPVRFGRHPRPNDPIVPGPRCRPGKPLTFRGGTTVYMGLKRDLAALGLRRVPALRHSMRATFLTILESDGANMTIARRATHRPPSDVVSGYIRTSWIDLCREVGRLRLTPRKGAEVVQLPRAVGDNRGDSREDGSGTAPENQGPQNSGCWTRTKDTATRGPKTQARRDADADAASERGAGFAAFAEGRVQLGTHVPNSVDLDALRRAAEVLREDGLDELAAAVDEALRALGSQA